MIGGALLSALLAESKNNCLILPVRDIEAACEKLGTSGHIIYIRHDFATTEELDYAGPVDYIIHGACPTSSAFMKEHPQETQDIIINGTRTMLDVAHKKAVKGMVFLSSLEVYGTVADDSITLTEEMSASFDPANPRNSYPIGKQMAEEMCQTYAEEHKTPVRIARLTQTFGTGVNLKTDSRVFAQFARCSVESKDIQLVTEGRTKRMYLHTLDAVSAIICLMKHGKDGEAYNIANPSTYCSIREMAEFVRDKYNPKIAVVYTPKIDTPYLPETYMRMSVDKMMSLGWTPRYGLKEMFDDVILR